MTEFRMPSLGADMESGLLVEWHIKPGDAVKRGDIVAVVETIKGAIDIEIFEDGVVEALLVREGTEVPVGMPLARLRGEGEAVVTTAPPAAEAPAPERAGRPEPPSAPPPTPPAPPAPSVRITPRARKRAQELGVDPARIVGSGPEGAITGEDIERAAQEQPQLQPQPQPRQSMQALIAATMSRSKREIPHYYLLHSIDLEPALQFLETHNAGAPPLARLLPVALLVRAVARALRDFPELCGWWQGGGFVASRGIHVGLAVSLRDGGLVNPAIHDADQGPLPELMAKVRDITQRARTSSLRASEFSDGAITVTNLGDQGVHAVLGVIHPPQVAIVGFGLVAARPWVVGGQLAARRIVDAALSADHRVSNGHYGGRFLRRVEHILSDPAELA